MIIFPAIDIKDGTCVRLVKGDYATAHKVAEDAVETAKSFQNAGASWIHMEQRTKNLSTVAWYLTCLPIRT